EYVKKLELEDLAPIQPAKLRGALQVLRQVATCPEQTGVYDKEQTTKDRRCLELIKEEVGKGNRVVVFSSWQPSIHRLNKLFKSEGMNGLVIDGRSTMAEKWHAVDEWRGTPGYNYLLGSMTSAGECINLTSVEDWGCRRVIFLNPDWVPAAMRQAWKRVHRDGQLQPVDVWYLYHRDTIEEHISKVLYDKQRVVVAAQDRVLTEDTYEEEVVRKVYQEVAVQVMQDKTDELS
ncbi:MAG: helicase-related protein, partial [Candidatus Thorarchaeota archaeon]